MILLKIFGAAFAPALMPVIAALILLFHLPTGGGAGQEMGEGLGVIYLGLVGAVNVYVVSVILFAIFGVTPKSFWWVTGASGGLALLGGVLVLIGAFKG